MTRCARWPRTSTRSVTSRRLVPKVALLLLVAAGMAAQSQVSMQWPQHAMDRPQPPVVDPGPFTASAPPPADAIVLFDGRSLAAWRSADSASRPARWKAADGYMEVVAGTGMIAT